MPAPARWVIGKPGDPSDEYASTAFSDWFQPADQVADAVTLSSAPTPAEAGGVSRNYDDSVLDPPAPDDNADLETTALADELTAAGDAGAGITAGALAISHTAWTVVEGGDPEDDDPFQIQHVLNGTRGASGQTIAASAQDLFWRDAWRTMAYPPNAIGYEVEQVELNPGFWVPVAEPLSAELQLTLNPTTFFGTVTNAEAIAVLNTLWGEGPVAFGFAGPLLDMTVERLAPQTLAAAEDGYYARVTTFAPYSGSGTPVVATIALDDLSACPPYTGLVGLHATVKNAGGTVSVENGNTLQINANASVSGTYVIRPPRIRWIYAEPEAEPYRRVFPRDDALGAGSARNWPPSKGYQSGRRVGGGYL